MKTLLLARADQTGLGVQTYEFYRALNPEVVLVDMSPLNHLATNYSLYPDSHVVKVSGYDHLGRDIAGLIARADILFTCETPYDYSIFDIARQYNTKTILQLNYELFDYIREPHLPKPDLFAAPSLWNFDQINFDNKMYLPVPINREILPFKQRTEAKRFLHIAGNPTIDDRNGTQLTLDAWHFVNSPVTLDVIGGKGFNIPNDPRIRCIPSVTNYWDLYKDYDVLLLPRKYGGLSLIQQEAMSCGLPVIMTDIAPQNGFLPESCLIPVIGHKEIMTKTTINSYETHPQFLAERIELFAQNPELIKTLSLTADHWASTMSWSILKETYLNVFRGLVYG